MVWYGMVWYGMVWYGMIWYGMVWYCDVWCDVMCLVWFGVLYCDMLYCGQECIVVGFMLCYLSVIGVMICRVFVWRRCGVVGFSGL